MSWTRASNLEDSLVADSMEDSIGMILGTGIQHPEVGVMAIKMPLDISAKVEAVDLTTNREMSRWRRRTLLEEEGEGMTSWRGVEILMGLYGARDVSFT